MTIDFAAINYWAVLVATVATFVLGGIWYGAVFGNAWVAAHGYTAEQVKEMGRNPARTFSIMFLCELVTAFVIAIFVVNMEIVTWVAGATLGFLLWIGIAAAMWLTDNVAHNRRLSAFIIDTPYHLIYLVMMGAIIGGWR